MQILSNTKEILNIPYDDISLVQATSKTEMAIELWWDGDDNEEITCTEIWF